VKIAVVGLWHQGVVAAGCFAEAGYDVTAADPSRDAIDRLNAGRTPVEEPGLNELLAAGVAAGRLRFTADLRAAVQQADIVCLMFDAPVDDNDRSDLTGIFDAVAAIAPSLKPGTVIWNTSQVPVGTSARLVEIMTAKGAPAVSMTYSPENLRLGQAIERFRVPPLPVIGSNSPDGFAKLAAALAPFCKEWRHVGLETAEMLKHALNAYLGVTVCFANELGALCDAVGANGADIATLLRLEPRVGPKAMLMPGLGFSGGTLARDVVTLRGLGETHGIETKLLDGLWAANHDQNALVMRRLGALLGDLKGKQVCVLGLTYKADTSTLRRSLSLDVIEALRAAGAGVASHDPGADPDEVRAQAGLGFKDDPYAAAAGADAVVLMTPWASYRTLDGARLLSVMRGKLLFDTAGLWSAEKMVSVGFTYADIGRGRLALDPTGRGR
jgi:UDPglucose 6-dehydrogenase